MTPMFRLVSLTLLAIVVTAPILPGGDARAQKQAADTVDLELVLAVDISRSMDQDEHTLQRDGYVSAFRHKDVINALTGGPEGRIAVTYMEWANDARQVIPWTIIDSAKAANDFADRLAAEPIYGERRTSITTALYEAERLIRENGITSYRQVIDVSGDGANNAGGPVEEARDFVLKRKININGLPILLHTNGQGGFGGGYNPWGIDIPNLDRYYKHCVIGGDGAFIAPVFDLKQLSATIRKKLVLEIASIEIEPDAAPVQYADAREIRAAGIERAQLKLPTEKPDCFAGEKARAMREGGRFP
ncbi:MAG: DUF1194 domain-containing protein [Hyphomonadaceae bacterium]|nr:DUF1194 domain-containing protein [Hyphomonadaceae bacterium]